MSDIHGNFNDSAVEFVSSSDLTLCLGDLGEMGEIREEAYEYVIKLASAGKLLVIPGNCDGACLRTFLTNHVGLSIHQAVVDFWGFVFAGFGGTVDAVTHARAMRAHFLWGSEAFVDSYLTYLENGPWLKGFIDTIGIELEDRKFKAISETPELITKWNTLRSSCEFEEHEIRQFFSEKAVGSDIWIVHTPPFGFPGSERLGGLSIGSRGLLDAICAKQPLLVISGHIHKEGEWQLGRTKCLSAPPLKNNLALSIEIDSTQRISSKTVEL